ncbi:hypothetical protein ACH4UV_05235 [Streptomyces sp. NPDC020802]|uniref:hypothetical protein n=1 Tax=Streptomyces sp. NPDC020802 TaxID=3365094 RepID=UPI0037B57060
MGSGRPPAPPTDGLLARTLYTVPPPGTGFTTADLHSGAQLMHCGGDVAEAALAVVLGVGWYTAGGRARARRSRQDAKVRSGPGPVLAGRAGVR